MVILIASGVANETAEWRLKQQETKNYQNQFMFG